MQLHSPDFGNIITVDTGEIKGRTQDGDLVNIYDSSWPQLQGFTVTFSGISEANKWALIEYFKDSAAEEVFFTDHENRTWKGFITSNLTIRQLGRACLHQATFTFEGELQL
jgi:hypothetical protein